MLDTSSKVEASSEHTSADEVLREFATMAFYVGITLLAALTGLVDAARDGDVKVIGVIWGTTIGLALAHLLAFHVSARLVGRGTLRRQDGELAFAQLGGAFLIAFVCTVPVLLFAPSVELHIARLLLAGLIGALGFAVIRSGGGSKTRSVLYGVFVLVLAATVAVLKNVLGGH